MYVCMSVCVRMYYVCKYILYILYTVKSLSVKFLYYSRVVFNK